MRARELLTERRRKDDFSYPAPVKKKNELASEIYRVIKNGGSVIWQPSEWQNTVAVIRSIKPIKTLGTRSRKHNQDKQYETTFAGDCLLTYSFIPGMKFADHLSSDEASRKGRWRSRKTPLTLAKSNKYTLEPSFSLGDSVYELVVKKHSLDEGWRDKAAAGLMAAGLAGGAYLSNDSATQTQTTQQSVAHTQAATELTKQSPQPQLKNPHEKYLAQVASSAGIVGDELAHLLAQAAHETNGWSTLREIGNAKYFTKRYDKKLNPRKAKILGNTQAGDGERFKGRGYLQITGRDNYRRIGRMIGVDLENNPQFLEKPEVAARAAIAYWRSRVQPKLDTDSSVRDATRRINPGMKGLKDRERHFKKYQTAQLDEIARIPQGDFGDSETLVAPGHPVEKKKLPGGSDYTYAVDKKPSDDIEIMIFDGDELIAELDLSYTQDFLKTWRVETIAVDPEHRGQGLGRALYGIALSILKLTVEAGQTQTRHGQRMWLMLNSIPGVEIKGYNMVPTESYRANPSDTVIDQNETWTRYLFPVKPGINSMQSTRRGAGIYSSHASMIAKWKGK